jgi:basic membrane lipoprotein Med (substrate-binding protein (PBP1-ABC) superfamily)
MKKVFFTAALAMTTLFASAQFMVITTVQEASDEAEGFEMEQVTENIGLGYMLNDKITVGLQKAGEDENGDAKFNLWARYSFGDNMWATVQAPSEESSDNLSVGVGYSLNVWSTLYVEPSYTMKLDSDSDEDGTLNLGLAYRF